VTRRWLIALSCLAAAGACSSKRETPLADDGGVKPRVFRPPPVGLRAVPPHNIHPEGIGPYRLGAPLEDILNRLPHGPRVELFRLGALADYSLVRAEGGAIVVGVERGRGVTFVSAVEGEVARTASGHGVGASADVIRAELGDEPAVPEVARDPALLRSSRLPEAVFLLEDGRVAAVLVDATGNRYRQPGRGDAGVPKVCPTTPALASELHAAARLGTAAALRVTCAEGAPVQAVASWGDRLVWLGVESAGAAEPKIRKLAATSVAGLRFAAPILFAGERAMVAVVETRHAGDLVLRLELFKLDGSRLVTADSAEIYRLSEDTVRLSGGSLVGASIAVELEAEGDNIVARGFFAQRAGHRLTVVAPLERRRLGVDLRSRGATSAPPASPDADAGSGDRDDEGEESGKGERDGQDRDDRVIGAP
jgi:hypothetical protein